MVRKGKEERKKEVEGYNQMSVFVIRVQGLFLSFLLFPLERRDRKTKSTRVTKTRQII